MVSHGPDEMMHEEMPRSWVRVGGAFGSAESGRLLACHDLPLLSSKLRPYHFNNSPTTIRISQKHHSRSR